ncbi:TPA: hypothetical protein HA278_04865, partial [Candidatus Woesearchaeota archaeon]|nr:hypothetical protein [Candidatus Woesearchaeota archaeon]
LRGNDGEFLAIIVDERLEHTIQQFRDEWALFDDAIRRLKHEWWSDNDSLPDYSEALCDLVEALG